MGNVSAGEGGLVVWDQLYNFFHLMAVVGVLVGVFFHC